MAKPAIVDTNIINQLWACAKLNNISFVLTEDMPSPAVVEGVHFVNPLEVGFDLDAWSAPAKVAT